MPALKIGVSLAALRLPFKEALPWLVERNVASVEIDARHGFKPSEFGPSAIREFRKKLADYRLRVGLVTYHTRRGYGEQDDLDARIAGTKTALKFAADLGCRMVANHIGLFPESEDSPERKLMIEVLTDLGQYGQKIGATLCAQTGPQPAAGLRPLFDALPPGALGIDLCPGTLMLYGHDPIDAITQLGEWIMHVHADDAAQGYGPARGKPAALGEGNVDWPLILGLLQERDYRGDYTLGYAHPSDAPEELDRAIKYLRKL